MKDLRSCAKAFLAAYEGEDVRLEECVNLAGPLAELYKTQPSAMRYEMQVGKMAHVGDIARRFREARGMYYNAEKGLNACGRGFLMRENGCYLMALIDCVELCSEQLYEHYRALIDIFRESMRGLLRWQDKKTGLFHQVIDQPEGDSVDLCGSAMAAYALYKAVRLGVLDGEKYLPIADGMFESVANGLPADKSVEMETAGACLKMCSEYLLKEGEAYEA